MRSVRAASIIVVFVLIGCGIVWYLYYTDYAPLPIVRRFSPYYPPRPVGILIHHSATPFRLNGRLVDARKINDMHKKRGFSIIYKGKVYHIGYHFVITPDGRIEAGRPENVPGAHAGNTYHNTRYLGVCVVGDFDSRGRWNGKRSPKQPTDAQIEALVKLSAQLMQKYDIPLNNVRCHRDVNQTYCPGDHFPYRRVQTLIAQELQRRIQNASVTHTSR